MKSGKDQLDEALDKNICTVSPETSIEQLLPMFMNTKYPIVVTDNENKVLGIIFKASVLAGLLGEGEDIA